MSSSDRWDVAERDGVRFVWDSSGCTLLQIRSFRRNAKIGDQVKVDNFYWGECCNLTNILHEDLNVADDACVNNLDILVPEQPIITNTNPVSPNISQNPTVNGTCGVGAAGEIVKDGDFVKIYHAEDNKLLGSGTITGNAFSIVVDLSSYNSGITVPLQAKAENERSRKHGPSAGSVECKYQIL